MAEVMQSRLGDYTDLKIHGLEPLLIYNSVISRVTPDSSFTLVCVREESGPTYQRI